SRPARKRDRELDQRALTHARERAQDQTVLLGLGHVEILPGMGAKERVGEAQPPARGEPRFDPRRGHDAQRGAEPRVSAPELVTDREPPARVAAAPLAPPLLTESRSAGTRTRRQPPHAALLLESAQQAPGRTAALQFDR